MLLHQTCILQPLQFWQIRQCGQIEGHQKALRRHESMGRATLGGAGAGGDQVARRQTSDQFAADLAPEDLLQPIARDRLVIGNRGEHSQLCPQIRDQQINRCLFQFLNIWKRQWVFHGMWNAEFQRVEQDRTP